MYLDIFGKLEYKNFINTNLERKVNVQEEILEAVQADLERLMNEMDRIKEDGQEYALLAQKLLSGLICYDITLARKSVKRLKAAHQFESALELYTHTGSEEDELLCRSALVWVPQVDQDEAQRGLDVQVLCWKGEIEAAVLVAEEADDPILMMSLIEEIKDRVQQDPVLLSKHEDFFRDRPSFEPEPIDGWSEEPEETLQQDPSSRMRVKMSVQRLTRFIEMKAPLPIIRSEVLLLLQIGEFGEAQRGLRFLKEPMPYAEDILGHIALGLIEKSRMESARAVFKRLTNPLMRAKVLLAFLLRRLQAARTLAS